MHAMTKQVLTLYVDRSTQQWIVRDPDGHFWAVPSVEDAWEHREPFQLAEGTDLAPVPGHYKYLLQLPF
jgi:hypothetical protein